MNDIKKIVFICHPLKGDIEGNLKKARATCRRIIMESKGEIIPLSTALYFCSFLDDTDKSERLLGIKSGHKLLLLCDEIHVYSINGYISEGMQLDINIALSLDIPIFQKGEF